MGAMPDYAVKVLIFGMTFSILLGFTCTVLAPYIPGLSGVSVVTVNSFQTFPTVVYGGLSPETNYSNAYIDAINVTYNAGWTYFNPANLNGQDYSASWGSYSHPWNYTRMQVHSPGLFGLLHYSNMYNKIYNYTSIDLNETDIIANWDSTINATEVYWRNDPTYNSTTWDITIFYTDTNLTRNNITDAFNENKIQVTAILGIADTGVQIPLGGGWQYNPDGSSYWNIPAIASGGEGIFSIPNVIISAIAAIGYAFVYIFMVIGWFVFQVAIFLQILLAPLQIATTLGVGGFVLVAVPLAVIDAATIFCFVLFIRSLIPT